MTSPVPGWYPDPSGMPGERWWDGGSWTRDTRPVPQPVPAYAPPGWEGLGYAPAPIDPSAPVPPYRSTPDDGYGRNGQPDAPAAPPSSWLVRNGYSLATVVVTAAYALILAFGHLAVLGLLPLFLGVSAVRRREPLAWPAVVIGVAAFGFGVYLLADRLL